MFHALDTSFDSGPPESVARQIPQLPFLRDPDVITLAVSRKGVPPGWRKELKQTVCGPGAGDLQFELISPRGHAFRYVKLISKEMVIAYHRL
jgi:hypothetical protein